MATNVNRLPRELFVNLVLFIFSLRLCWECSHLDWLKMEEECSIHVHRLRDPSMYSNRACRLVCVLRSRELRGRSWKEKCPVIWTLTGKEKSRPVNVEARLHRVGHTRQQSLLPAVDIVDCICD